MLHTGEAAGSLRADARALNAAKTIPPNLNFLANKSNEHIASTIFASSKRFLMTQLAPANGSILVSIQILTFEGGRASCPGDLLSVEICGG